MSKSDHQFWKLLNLYSCTSNLVIMLDNLDSRDLEKMEYEWNFEKSDSKCREISIQILPDDDSQIKKPFTYYHIQMWCQSPINYQKLYLTWFYIGAVVDFILTKIAAFNMETVSSCFSIWVLLKILSSDVFLIPNLDHVYWK